MHFLLKDLEIVRTKEQERRRATNGLLYELEV